MLQPFAHFLHAYSAGTTRPTGSYSPIHPNNHLHPPPPPFHMASPMLQRVHHTTDVLFASSHLHFVLRAPTLAQEHLANFQILALLYLFPLSSVDLYVPDVKVQPYFNLTHNNLSHGCRPQPPRSNYRYTPLLYITDANGTEQGYFRHLSPSFNHSHDYSLLSTLLYDVTLQWYIRHHYAFFSSLKRAGYIRLDPSHNKHNPNKLYHIKFYHNKRYHSFFTTTLPLHLSQAPHSHWPLS